MSARDETPWERWSRDTRELGHMSEEELKRAFEVYFERSITNDRLVPIEGVLYELPRGLHPGGRRGRRVQITERLLEATYHVQCGGRLVRIHPVDLAFNARSRRDSAAPADEGTRPPPEKTAADLAFERDLSPLVDEEGSALFPADEPPEEGPTP